MLRQFSFTTVVALGVSALISVGLAGCEKTVAPPADTAVEAKPAIPDPAAPAPGTQAAEAIGADSASTPPITSP